MNKFAELENKYEELGKEIEKLKLAEAKSKAVDGRGVGFEDDCIFLLSIKEYKKYKNKIPNIYCWWWLRSPSTIYNRAAYVYVDSSFISFGFPVNDKNGNGIRPALKVCNLKPIKCSDGMYRVIYCGVTWVQIDKNLYISEMPIMFDKFDEGSNDYKHSYIRKKLNEWLHDRVSLE